MSTRTVRTKEALKEAQKDGVNEIIVEGKLAEDLKATRKIATLSTGAIAALSAVAAGVVIAPATGGTSAVISAVAAAPLVVATGLSIPAITFACIIGVAFLVTLFKEYDMEISAGGCSVKLTKKGKTKD